MEESKKNLKIISYIVIILVIFNLVLLGIGIGGLLQMLILVLTAVISAKLFLDPALLEIVLVAT